MLNGSRNANVGYPDPVLMLTSSYYEDSTQDSASAFKCMFAFPKFSTGEVSLGKVLNANPILLRWPVLVCYS